MKKIKEYFIFKYYWYKRKIQFYYAKKKADAMHQMTGKRYFVVPAGKKLSVVNNDVMKVFNKNAKQRMTIVDLLNMSYYSTK